MMDTYNVKDFVAYYGGAWLLHPTLGVACCVRTVSERGVITFSDSKGVNLNTASYRTLDFTNFVARLGYRHLDEGSALFYITRRARRQAAKGLRDTTVSIAKVPEVDRLYALAGSSQPYRSRASWSGELIERAFVPVFVPLAEAVAKLRADDNVVGLALSHSFAVTLLSSNTDTPLVILFKGQRVAFSADGTVWKATNPEYYNLLKRSIPLINLETQA